VPGILFHNSCRPRHGKPRENGASAPKARVVEGNEPAKRGQGLHAFAEKPWGAVFVRVIVIALIVFAKPSCPNIQMPQ
jgi:hypothetical protein